MIKVMHVDVEHIPNETCRTTTEDPQGRFPKVIIQISSSSAIPGNVLSISKTINKLYLQGVKVYTSSSLADLHTSGHANEEEVKLLEERILRSLHYPCEQKQENQRT